MIRICERAIAIDPNYARAWALMAMAQRPAKTIMERGEGDGGLAAADRALALDPNLAEAHAVKALILSERGEAEAPDGNRDRVPARSESYAVERSARI